MLSQIIALKIAGGHLMPPQQHLFNGLASSTNYSIFAREWTRPLIQPAGIRPSCLPTASLLAYGQRAQDERMERCWHATDKGLGLGRLCFRFR